MKHQRVIHAQCAMYHIYMHTQAFEVWLQWDISIFRCVTLRNANQGYGEGRTNKSIVTNFVDPAERGALRCSERRLPCDL